MKRSVGGFNLLEVILGAFIFSTVSIGLMGVWISHHRSLGKSRNNVVANLLAQAVIERAIADGFFGLPDSSSTLVKQTVTTSLNGQVIDVGYDIQTDISRFGVVAPLPPAREDKLKKVSVRVSWTEPSGSRDLTLETIVASAD